ncbi:MAG: hypothetical protein JW384_01213 [Nitrosomonadaceae bacterium]|nr:hypothetical protein [Nitrosomonadaceae bacterium]
MSHMPEGIHLRYLQRVGSLMRSRGNVSAALESILKGEDAIQYLNQVTNCSLKSQGVRHSRRSRITYTTRDRT